MSHPRIEAHRLNPESLPASDPERRTDAVLVEPVLRAIQAAVADDSVTAAHTAAGRIHLRKSENLVTVFGSTPNPRYSSAQDDFYLQIGVRISSHAAKDVLDAVRDVELLSNKQLLEEARARLAEAEERTAAAQATETRIRAEIDRLTGRG